MSEEKPIKTMGQVAYEAYCDARGFTVENGCNFQSFEDGLPELREAWELAAKAVALFIAEN
jgi:hypothetical protein